MLLRTYDRIIELFKENRGYMSFREMKNKGVTELQIQELKKRGVLECYARGNYWCGICGFEKPDNYKYVEVGHAFPESVLCMQTAAYLHGMIRKEPEEVSLATARENRQKVSIYFPVHRYYFQNADMEGEIEQVETDYGSYRIYNRERTVCDCIRLEKNLDEGVLEEMLASYHPTKEQIGRILTYAKSLRALKPVQNTLQEKYGI